MTEASCAPLDLSELPAGLRPKPIIVDGLNVPRSEALAEANRFEDGQISGPFGPKFVGWGPMPELTLREKTKAVAEWAGIIAVLSGLIILARAL